MNKMKISQDSVCQILVQGLSLTSWVTLGKSFPLSGLCMSDSNPKHTAIRP